MEQTLVIIMNRVGFSLESFEILKRFDDFFLIECLYLIYWGGHV
jgi:hypothetical protein